MSYSEKIKEIKLNSKHWLVTGGAGFIGSNIAERLLSLGQRVTVYDNLSTGKRSNIEILTEIAKKNNLQSNFHFIEGKIEDLAKVRQIVKGVDYISHQAALGSVPRSIADPIGTHNANLTGFLNVLIAASENQVKGFVYASSSSVYGDSVSSPKREEDTGSVLSPYAATKKANELYAESFSERCLFQIIGLRYFNVFGPRQDPEGAYAAVIPKWINELLLGNSPTIYGDGKTSRDFCFIENVVQANILAVLRSESVGTRKAAVYNVAAGAETNLNELCLLIREKIAEYKGINLNEMPEPTHQDFRQGDIRRSLADLSAITNALGYEPSVSLKEGVKETVNWFIALSVENSVLSS